jgi:glycosyltransferase involved in cell wall biosynthesis
MNRLDVGIFFGRPVRSQSLAMELRARGFSVTIYNDRGAPGTYKPVPMRFFPALARIFSTHHNVYLTSFCYTPALCLYLNRLIRGIPYIFNAVGLISATYQERSLRWPFPRLPERWFYPLLTDRILGGASGIVCNSEYLQRRLALEYPKYAHKMVTIYNGIDFEAYAKGQTVTLAGIPSSAARLLAIMTWDYEGKSSGARLLIDAMEFVAKEFPEARLVIAAKTRHQRYAQAIERYLAAKPWSASIRVLYNQTNIPDLLASSDLLVYATPPESNDSLPRALLEAHAAGVPIVASATAGCPEVIENSVTGYLVPYEASALANRVIELLHDSDQRQKMGKCGQMRIRELFSWERMGEAYANLLHKAVTEGPRDVAARSRVEDRTTKE